MEDKSEERDKVLRRDIIKEIQDRSGRNGLANDWGHVLKRR